MSRAAPALVLLALASAACRDDGVPPPRVSVVRIADLDPSSFDSALEEGDDDLLFDRLSRPVLTLDGRPGATFPVVPLLPLVPLCVDVEGEGLDERGVVLRAVERTRRPAPPPDADLGPGERVLDFPSPGEASRARLRLRPGADATALVLDLQPGPNARIDRVVVRMVEDGLADALGSRIEGRPWFVRRVGIERTFVEAVVLGAPGEARYSLRVPRGARSLDGVVAAGASGDDAAVVVEITVERERTAPSVERMTLSGPPRWRPVSLPLPAPAGTEPEVVTVRLVAKTSSGAGGGPRLAVFGGLAFEAAAPPPDDAPPDVVLVSLDTVRADRTSLLDPTRATTPHLEALARRAHVFRQAIAPAPWTLPSHGTLLSGQEPECHGALLPHVRLDPAATPLLARELRARGYRTAAFTGGGFVHPAFGFAEGFERYGTADPVAAAAGQEDSPLLEFLASPGAAPRFVFVHTYAAHGFEPLPEDVTAVGGDLEALRAIVGAPGTSSTLAERVARLRDDPNGRAVLDDVYDASIRRVDALVGDVVQALRAAGRLRRTLLVVTSDHGQELLERGAIGHGATLHEEVLHVPLLVAGPGVRPGVTSDVVTLADVPATLREWIGIVPDAPVDGRSLLPLLRGDAGPVVPAVATRKDAEDDWSWALRGPRLKLILEQRPGRELEARLYRLDEDPGERHDLAPSEPELVRSLRRVLEERVAALRAGRAQDGAGADVETPPELRSALEELGYLGGE